MAFIVFYQVSLAIALALLLYRYSRKKNGASLPPGPKPLPVVGNLLDLPPHDKPEFEHWLKFKDTYGPVCSLNVWGTTMVVIHDHDALHEVLTKKSTKTATRPNLRFANELCGMGDLLPSQLYGENFRHQRKLIHQQVGTKGLVKKFNKIQDVESRRFLFRVHEEPEGLVQHLKTEAASIVLKFAYGYSIAPDTIDPLVTLIGEMVNGIINAEVPLTWMMDIIPGLEYVPSWFPGGSFKRLARKWKRATDLTKDIPYQFVRRKMADGSHYPSFVSGLVSRFSVDASEKGDAKLSEYDEAAIKSTAAIVYAGGADTTVSTLAAFVLAMVLFPKVQEKAQKELDDVVGFGNLPGFEHQEQLPYINAIIKEALRWFPIVPMGVTHVSQEELTVLGYRIPKGSYILPAVWWFCHDEKRYPNPMEFDPERFLAPRNEPDPLEDIFGYGLRICPGRYFAQDNLYITVSRFLAAFTMSKALDAEKNEITPEALNSPGLISYPKPFPYRVRPRSDELVELIKSVVNEHPWDDSDSKVLKEFSEMA